MTEREWEVAGPVTESDVLKALVNVRGREIARRLSDATSSLPEGFAVEHSRAGGLAVVALSGDLDVGSSASVRDIVGRLVDDGPVVVDLRKVSFLDSMGLGALIASKRRSPSAAIALVLAPDQHTVRKLFQTTSLDRIFPICESVDDAVAVLTAPKEPLPPTR